ncbi:AI-2E family transporter [Actinomadura rupiterrae]|uniref:AI-2E family transporter n=1 Tax=Actinomadura rupiterrae TaxID=559627 RepID=UPI0020A545E9|nr:AI-2E family transporter [Actinomadura rupiterrae]MCP2338273.1 putative PurR-regulated permease PerM [Actinomadura rupiterrae]
MANDRTTADHQAAGGRGSPMVPPLLSSAAAWAWRLIAIGILVYGLSRVVGTLKIVFLPCAVALFLTALLRPLTVRFQRLGLSPLAATWLTLLFALAVLGGIGTYVGIQANEEFPKLVSEVQDTSKSVQHWLENGPLHVQHSKLTDAVDQGTKWIEARRGKLASTALDWGTATLEALAAIVFLLFVTFFLLKDGPNIWRWTISGSGRYRGRIDRAGRAAWETLSQYVHGTCLVAAIHAVVLAIVLAVMGVPLVAPLAVVIFLGSFIPIVGIFVGGGLAVAVTFGAKGGVAALIFLGILLVEHQLESHLLQPMVVGRWVRLHPLAVILAITVGGVLAGIPGAAVAVPIVAVVYRAWPALRGDPEPTPAEDPEGPPDDPDTPARATPTVTPPPEPEGT